MIIFVLLCCLASFKLASFLSDREMREQKIRIDTGNRNMAMVLAENSEHAFQQADTLLRFMKAEWESSGTISPHSQKILDEMRETGIVSRIFVADMSGDIVFNVAKLPKKVNIAYLERFQQHRKEDTGKTRIGATITNDAEGRPTFFISRRLNQANGEFAGIVSVGIRQDYLLELFRNMELGEENSLSLLHTNGNILARIPGIYDKEAFAIVFNNHPSLSSVKSGITVGEYEVPGADGIPRFGSFRQLSGYPVIALATTKREAAFRDVISRQMLYRNLAATFSVIIMFAVLLIWLQLRKQYNTEMNLLDREKQLTYISYHDALTGIYNRAYFYAKSKDVIPQMAVIMADFDGLKVINDTFGHKMGDKALQETAQIITDCLPSDGFVARVGGDEFAVVLFSTTTHEIKAVCGAIRQKIDNYNRGTVIPLHLSLGYALVEEKEMTSEELLAAADKWMYREKLRQSGTKRSQFYNTLKEMLVARDYITEGHATRVTTTTVSLAKAAGVPSVQIPDIELFAYFHDLGKVGVSDSILNKCGPLTENERQEMQQHSEIGHRIASAMDNLAMISDWILKHHERWDGKGYPYGIAKEDIPIECRILAITDAYDAMISDRPYRKAMSSLAALEELCRNAGTQFDPNLVEKFVAIIKSDRSIDKNEKFAVKGDT